MNTWWVSPDQLNAEQLKIIDDLDTEKSHIVFGPPGSGKTNLLLLRANHLYLGDQKNIELIVFTKTLHCFFSAGGHQYDFPDDKVKTSTRWQIDLLNSFGVPIRDDETFDECREHRCAEIESLIAKRNLAGMVECILLDEAHDYTPREIVIFKTIGRRVFAVADDKQRIYSTPDCLETLKNGIPSIHVLKYHYRIGKKICAVADHIAKDSADYVPMINGCNYDEVKLPSTVESVTCTSLADQIGRMLEKFDTQIKAYPNEIIGVLCPTRDAVQAVWEHVEQSSFRDVAIRHSEYGHPEFTDDVRVSVSTVHAAKGLEFRAVHFMALDQLGKLKANRRNVAFTAVTRAKTSLSVYCTGPLPGFLDQAIAAVQPPSGPPNIKDVFGRRNRG